MLKAQGLRYVRDGQEILANVDVIVEPGESLAVTGPSGSGKTSLLALLSGLTAPTAGEVYIDGKPLTKFAGPALGVAVVLQGYGLVSLLTAAENIEVALRAAGRPAKAAIRTAREVLAQLGLEVHADQLVEELSGGQQQRTAVARALALEPRLLIADEPTAELDPAARAVALARMFEVAINGGAMILATHDSEVADRCDRILDLREGAVKSQPGKPPPDQPALARAPVYELAVERPPPGQAADGHDGPDEIHPGQPDQAPLGEPPPDQPVPPPQQDLRPPIPRRRPAHALPKPPPPDVDEGSGPAAIDFAHSPPGPPSPAAVPPGIRPAEPGPGYSRPAWPQPPRAQQPSALFLSGGLSAQHQRLMSAAVPPLHRRGARLREYLDEVRRRAYNALPWLAASASQAQRADASGPARGVTALGADELAFLQMARDDLVGFADLGLRLLELHQPMDLSSGTGDPAGPVPRCLSCMWRWPCPTFLTLAEILQGRPGSE
jgi:ABC-type lipoprotein export system ATPase subunit